jgi:hypothetical protein
MEEFFIYWQKRFTTYPHFRANRVQYVVMIVKVIETVIFQIAKHSTIWTSPKDYELCSDLIFELKNLETNKFQFQNYFTVSNSMYIVIRVA